MMVAMSTSALAQQVVLKPSEPGYSWSVELYYGKEFPICQKILDLMVAQKRKAPDACALIDENQQSPIHDINWVKTDYKDHISSIEAVYRKYEARPGSFASKYFSETSNLTKGPVDYGALYWQQFGGSILRLFSANRLSIEQADVAVTNSEKQYRILRIPLAEPLSKSSNTVMPLNCSKESGVAAYSLWSDEAVDLNGYLGNIGAPLSIISFQHRVYLSTRTQSRISVDELKSGASNESRISLQPICSLFNS
ncbi:MAG TPA: hypothetical protein VND94_08405 [Terriglobia bacterium]|nr:hypothetical protein [Terriglobia bacterium]